MKRLLKKLVPKGLILPLLPAYHLARAVAANVRSGFPARKLKVIAVTGTNGKTTTTLYIARILQAAGYRVGYSTSVELVIGDKVIEEKEDSSAGPGTTRDAFVLQKLMKRMKAAKVDWVLLEVTSHALSQHRIWGVPIHTAVFTNLSQDHLDYHGTMEHYMAAKARLFKAARHNRVLNRDDEAFDYFANQGRARLTSYGQDKKSDVQLSRATFKLDGSELHIKHGTSTTEATIQLPGKFNAYNALSAAAVSLSLGVEETAIQSGLAALSDVSGRMEQLETSKGFRVIVDYAHSPDAFDQVFSSLRTVTKGRLIAVFGGHVQHDYKGLGEAAGRGADLLIVTDDEPETADPIKIRHTILDAAKQSDTSGKKEMLDIADRRKGIEKAFQLAKKDDVVMLLCLGHQKYRRIGTKKIAWSDREEAEKALTKLGLKKKT